MLAYFLLGFSATVLSKPMHKSSIFDDSNYELDEANFHSMRQQSNPSLSVVNHPAHSVPFSYNAVTPQDPTLEKVSGVSQSKKASTHQLPARDVQKSIRPPFLIPSTHPAYAFQSEESTKHRTNHGPNILPGFKRLAPEKYHPKHSLFTETNSKPSYFGKKVVANKPATPVVYDPKDEEEQDEPEEFAEIYNDIVVKESFDIDDKNPISNTHLDQVDTLSESNERTRRCSFLPDCSRLSGRLASFCKGTCSRLRGRKQQHDNGMTENEKVKNCRHSKGCLRGLSRHSPFGTVSKPVNPAGQPVEVAPGVMQQHSMDENMDSMFMYSRLTNKEQGKSNK